MFVVLLVCGVVVTGLLILDQVRERQRIYNQILELRAQQEQLLAELTRLQIEQGSESSLDRVVEVARADMEMKFPDEVVRVESGEQQ